MVLKPAAFTNVLFSNLFMVSNQKQAILGSRIHVVIHLLLFGFFPGVTNLLKALRILNFGFFS
jgi:hypothetical protein